MNDYETGFERVAQISIGLAALAGGAPTEAGLIAPIAAIGGALVDQRRDFGPESERVRRRIRAQLRKDYAAYIVGEGDDWAMRADLRVADAALADHLGDCVIDQAALAAAAVTPDGFRAAASSQILTALAARNAALFDPDGGAPLAAAYAQDVVRIALETVATDLDYFRGLAPHLHLTVARRVAAIDAKVDQLLAENKAAKQLGYQEKQLVALAYRYAGGAPEDDFDAAFRNIETALDAAADEAARDGATDLDAALSAILKRLDALNAEGRFAAAAAALDDDIRAVEAEKRATLLRLHERGVLQGRLANAPERTARHVVDALRLDAVDDAAAWRDLMAAQGYWHEHGRDYGVNFDLLVALALAETATTWKSRTGSPLDWATAQNNFGNTLAILGERESGTTRLTKAVSVYRDALKERTRGRVPYQWATTQNNLGGALQSLGKRQAGTKYFKDAVVAFRAALEQWDQNEAPLDWAMAQNNLGNALLGIGERDNDYAQVEAAISAYQAALEEWTRDQVPLYWAAAQNNLGNALLVFGRERKNITYLREAVFAYREALKERKRNRVPLDWAMTQNNIGNALLLIGEKECGTERLKEAADAYCAASEERTVDRAPYEWATTQMNCAILAYVFIEKAIKTSDDILIDNWRLIGLRAIDDSLSVFSPDQTYHDYVRATEVRADLLCF